MGHIELHNVCLSYGTTIVAENLSVEVNSSEIVCLFGPSGCGKTTILRTVLGMMPAARGRVSVEGYEASRYPYSFGYVPQDNELLRWLNVARNVSTWHEESAKNAMTKNGMSVEEALGMVELTDSAKKMPCQLSGGMARRTVLARSLVTHTNMMLLDEPFVSVERRLRRKLMVAVRSHIKETHCAAVLVSHDFEEATFFADRILFLSAQPVQVTSEMTVELPADRRESLFDSDEFNDATLRLIRR